MWLQALTQREAQDHPMQVCWALGCSTKSPLDVGKLLNHSVLSLFISHMRVLVPLLSTEGCCGRLN